MVCRANKELTKRKIARVPWGSVKTPTVERRGPINLKKGETFHCKDRSISRALGRELAKTPVPAYHHHCR